MPLLVGSKNSYNGSGNGDASNGAGGLIIIYADTFCNNNTISADGSVGTNNSTRAAGGSSGGGSINIFYKSITNRGNIHATGGNGSTGGNGGDGSVVLGNISTGTFVKN